MKPDRLIGVSTPRTLINVNGKRNLCEAHLKRQQFALPGKWLTVKKGPGRDPPHRSDSFEPYPIL